MAISVSHLPFCDWLTILFHPIKVKVETKRDSGTRYGFPALTAVVAVNSARENE